MHARTHARAYTRTHGTRKRQDDTSISGVEDDRQIQELETHSRCRHRFPRSGLALACCSPRSDLAVARRV